MSKVSLKIGIKGVSKGVTLSSVYDENCELTTLDNVEDKELVRAIRDIIREDIEDSDCAVSYCQDAAYVELIEEDTDTRILVVLSNVDHDGNELYLDACEISDDGTCIIDVDNNNVLLQILEGIMSYEGINTAIIKDGVVTFEENTNHWLDMSLINAIKTLKLEDKYGKETMEQLEKDYGTIGFSDKWIDIDTEVLEIEHKELRISELLKKYTGKKIVLEVDCCGAVFGLTEVEEFDIESLKYTINYDIGLIYKE